MVFGVFRWAVLGALVCGGGLGFSCQAADQTRRPKRKELRSLSELRAVWRESAARAYGADVVAGLAEHSRAAAAAIWARVRPVVDIALAAVNVAAVVFVMRGGFKHHHLLAEARRHLAYVLRGRPHQPGLDEEIVQAAIDSCTRPASRRMMTADLRTLYPHDTEDRAALRALTRKRSAAPYERARLAAGALTARVHALRRADRPNSRPRSHTVAVPTTPRPNLRPGRAERKAGRDLEPMTDVSAVELTSRTLEAAAAEMAARLQAGLQERAASRRPAPQPAPATAPPPHAQQPAQLAPGRTPPTGGIA
ncbi:hypothetical protein [Streptomyces sp. NPDC007369]|uniref:hypothetical protein n=1 Tax=Streptomyces sp. NPDC007369 TaxID=3154589 RepID=UPI003400BF2B